MKKNFKLCLSRVLKDEGGYTNDLNDSGGPTKYGITISDVRKYIKSDATSQDVRNLTLDQASSIYKIRYWDALSCDDLPSGVDYTCFDYGVNSGIGRPRKALQRFKNLSGTKLIEAINNERTAFLKALSAHSPKDQKFLRGWLSRVQRVNDYSLQLAKDNISGPSIGTGITGLCITLAACFHHYEWYILVGGLITGILVGTIIHILRNKK